MTPDLLRLAKEQAEENGAVATIYRTIQTGQELPPEQIETESEQEAQMGRHTSRAESTGLHMADPPDVSLRSEQDHQPASVDLVWSETPLRCQEDIPLMRGVPESQVWGTASSKWTTSNVCWTSLTEGGGGPGRPHA